MTSLQSRLSVAIAILALGAATTLLVIFGRPPTAAPLAEARMMMWLDLLPDDEAEALASLEAAGPTSEEDWLVQEAARSVADPSGADADDAAWDVAPQEMPDALPRDDLDGVRVALSGYMTPLDFEAMETRGFLLVPYVGACIHVPAPPANQIVFVESATPVPVIDMWQPFTAIGTLRVQRLETELAESAYVMELERMVALDITGGPDEEYGGEMR